MQTANLRQQCVDLETAAMVEITAKGRGNANHATATGQVNGHTVEVTIQPAYSQAAQRLCYRTTWKVDYKRTAASSVLAQVSR